MKEAQTIIDTADKFLQAIRSAILATEGLGKQLRAIEAQQKEIKHLRVKSWTLGLTWREERRIKNKEI